jgi:hypothetical protein
MSRLVQSPIDARLPELRQATVNRDVEQRLADQERMQDYWHVVGGGAPEPSFASGWRPYPSGTPTTFFTPSFRKINGVVHLRGLVEKTSAISAGETIFTLPVGYRPDGFNHAFVVVTSPNAIGRVDVAASGAVTAQLGSNLWISLDTIRFAL